MLDSILQDVRFATRLLARDRVAALGAVSLLTIGIGSTVVMADMLDRVLLRPPSGISVPERVRRLYDQSGSHPSLLTSNFVTLGGLVSALDRDLEAAASYLNESVGLGRGPDAKRLRAVTYTPGYFDVLGLTPAAGVLPSGHVTAAPDVAVISHALWQQQFGGAADTIGRTVRLGTRFYTIVAVTPSGFAGIDDEPTDIWLPLDSRAEDGSLQRDWRTSSGYSMLRAVVRLRAGVDRNTVEARASTLYNTRFARPWADGKAHPTRILLGDVLLARQPGGSSEGRLIAWVAAVSGIVLLIACGNVGSLMLVRGLRRSRELAMKSALGASRLRLLREIMCEAALLALASGAGALLFTVTGGTLVRRVFLPSVTAAVVPLDGRLLALTALVTVGAAFLLGIVPAIRLTTAGRLNPGRDIVEQHPSRLLDLYCGLQVAMSVPLIVGASLFAVSFERAREARQANLGMQLTNVMVLRANYAETGQPGEAHSAHRRMAERLRAFPQVASAALTTSVPMVEATMFGYTLPDVKSKPDLPMGGPWMSAVDESFFAVMGMRLKTGRLFTDRENTPGGQPVAVINEAMARAFWPDSSPLSSCIRVERGENPPCSRIIGVLANSAMWASLDFHEEPPPVFYVPIEQYEKLTDNRVLLVKTNGPPENAMAFLRSQAQLSGPDLPYVDVQSFDEILDPTLRPLRLGATVFLAFGVLALVLAAVGLGAVSAYGVTRRTRELGIRLALGADPRGLVMMLLGRSLVAVAFGLAAGAALSWAGGRSLESMLYEIKPGDPRALAGSAAFLLIVALISAYVPARRAAAVNPVEALRRE